MTLPFKKLKSKRPEPSKSVLDFKKELSSRGIIVPIGAEFYRVVKDGRIGMKVGEYTHSCHIDTMDFVVLLFADFRLGDGEAFETVFEASRIY